MEHHEMLIKFGENQFWILKALSQPIPLTQYVWGVISPLGEAKGTLACTVLGEGKTEVFGGEGHPHTQWTPAESKTGQDSSGLIRQRTHELKSGGGNMTFFFSILSIGTTRLPVKLPGEKLVR